MSEGMEAVRPQGPGASPWLPLLPRMTLVLVSVEGQAAFLRFCEQNGLETRPVGRCPGLHLVSPGGFHAADVSAVLREGIESIRERLRSIHEGRVQPGELGPAEMEAGLLAILREIEGEQRRSS